MASKLRRLALPLLMLLALAGAATAAADVGAGSRKLLAVSGSTRLQYSTDAARLAGIWVNPADFEILGGAKAPKFTGSAISSGVIQWARTDKHSMAEPMGYQETAVLTTGDAKRAISRSKYTGESAPTYPDIVNSHIKDSHDAVVLDFWVKSKKTATLIPSMYAATNEGHPAAAKLHTKNPKLRPRDVLQFVVDERVEDGGPFNLLYEDPAGLCDVDQDLGMQYYTWSELYEDDFKVKKGVVYHFKLRIADTGDRFGDSAVYLKKGGLRTWVE